MKVALVALALAACESRDPKRYDYETITLKKPAGPPAPAPSAPAADAQVKTVVPSTTRQLITGVIDHWSSTRATLQLWTRTEASHPWTAAGATWSAVIGTSGAAWGTGLHADVPEPAKREGDGKAPAGAFRLRGAYGYAAAPPDGTKLPYARSDKLECIDDPDSKHYTKILAASAARDWKSSEPMRLSDHQYTWVIDIAHNPSATPQGGSCIFFHVWSDEATPTVGCTAMAEPKLTELMKQLDPAADPVYVLLPRAEYERLSRAWGLPDL